MCYFSSWKVSLWILSLVLKRLMETWPVNGKKLIKTIERSYYLLCYHLSAGYLPLWSCNLFLVMQDLINLWTSVVKSPSGPRLGPLAPQGITLAPGVGLRWVTSIRHRLGEHLTLLTQALALLKSPFNF